MDKRFQSGVWVWGFGSWFCGIAGSGVAFRECREDRSEPEVSCTGMYSSPCLSLSPSLSLSLSLPGKRCRVGLDTPHAARERAPAVHGRNNPLSSSRKRAQLYDLPVSLSLSLPGGEHRAVPPHAPCASAHPLSLSLSLSLKKRKTESTCRQVPGLA